MDTNSISHIYKNIYISDYDKASDINTILKHNIGAVLYLGSREKPVGILKNYENYNIDYEFIQINDNEDANLSTCYKKVWNFINASIKKNVVVHCRYGVSRSPSVVAYYLMRLMHSYMKSRNEKYPVLDDVLMLIYKNRPCIKPNSGFLKQLKLYENKKINIGHSVHFAPGTKL